MQLTIQKEKIMCQMQLSMRDFILSLSFSKLFIDAVTAHPAPQEPDQGKGTVDGNISNYIT